MDKKILHVVRDDKFIDGAIREMEAVEPGIHDYLIVDDSLPFKYIRSPKVRVCDKLTFSREASRDQIKSIIFHSLHISSYDLLDLIPASKKVFWFGWGFDYYDILLRGLHPQGHRLPATISLCRSNTKEYCIDVARETYRWVRRNLFSSRQLKRVDYFCVLDLEFRLARELNPWLRANYIPWYYGTVEDDFSLPGYRPETIGDNLLIGNSATSTNNHIEIFQIIADRFEITNRKLIVPLSYGEERYRDRVIDQGIKLFGSAFVPLTDFLPYDEYIRILNSCGIVMMNHLRQQALGNICISGLIGAKLLLNRRNPLFTWLTETGIAVYDIETGDLTPLSQDIRESNVRAIRAHWGRDAQRARTRQLLDLAIV